MTGPIADTLYLSGAGKSSLIRLLNEPNPNEATNRDVITAAPVVGRSTCEVPTSADVHPHADPKSFDTDRPILYAGCEGFNGGERDQTASLAVANGIQGPSDRLIIRSKSPNTFTTVSSRTFTRLARGTKRALKLARRGSLDYERASKRGYALQQMHRASSTPFPTWSSVLGNPPHSVDPDPIVHG